MEQYNSKEIRKKRDQIQQLTISICCLGLLIFVFAWLVNVGVNGVKLAKATSSSTTAVDAKTSSVAKDKSSKSDKKDDSKKKDSESKATDKNPADDDFADAVFIGDSRTVGLYQNSDRPKATYYASTGLNVGIVEDSETIELDNGNFGTIYDALAQKQFGRVYIMFGINELGWPYPDIFQENYEEIINRIKELQPDATIYVQSILPVSDLALEKNYVFTNENVNAMNSYVQNAAANTGATYIDVAPAVADEYGALPEEASTDGIHLTKEYLLKWMDYLAVNS